MGMKKIFILTILAVLLLCRASAQKEFIVTSTKANNYCNGTCTLIDNPDLNGNPTAVIFITALEVNSINLDPHSICAYYTGKQWSVINTDNATMPPGSQFNVKFYTKPDENHFVHVVTKENLVKNFSYIDNALLNGNPNAQFQYFQNAAPNVRGGGINRAEIKPKYDAVAGKWYIINTNGSTLDYATGYSIIISEVTVSTNSTSSTPPVSTSPFTPGTKSDNTGQRMFMTVVGKIQGQFTGENNTTRIEVTGFEFELNSPRDLSTGQATGRRIRMPIMVQKLTSPSSIQFFKALTTNEQITSVTLEVYRPSASGSSSLDYKIVLNNASISYFKQTFSDDQKGLMDTIKIISSTVTLTYGAMSSSDTL